MKRFALLCMFVSSSLLLSCGDSSTTEVTQIVAGDFKTVETKDDLPKCTTDNQGNFAYVSSLSH